VTVGKNSDIGAGASIMGTLSGAARRRMQSANAACLGANAGIGISLGDDCFVEAGRYVTAGTKVRLSDGMVVTAKLLSGKSGLVFRRKSQTGALERMDGERVAQIRLSMS
jgi:2,3,4,5-tetrahydropyridine-2,6-dicarboxylate N-succinyltransferase